MGYRDEVPFSVLLGKTITSIDRDGDESLTFHTDAGSFLMIHRQDCCESVEIAEIIGSLDDLLDDGPVLLAEVTENVEGEPKPEYPDSWTWTFYKLRTLNGDVTIRWLGESNGYYSESVEFEVLT